jgi:type IV pilus assembly protein PilW
VANPALFGVGDCTYADVFQGASVTPGTGVITVSATGLNATAADFASRYTASPAGQTTLYRAESMVYYVGNRAGATGSSLYRVRFGSTAGGALVTSTPEEIVEGIENMQMVYGQDQGTVTTLTGNVTDFNTADTLGAAETEWRRVGQVQVGLLARSPDPAAATAAEDGNNERILGTRYTPPADARFRTTYETTIALRNRLYGN